MAKSYEEMGKDATKSFLGGANIDVRKDLLEVPEDARSFFIRATLRTY